MDKGIENLNLQVKDNVKNYLSEMTLKKIVRTSDNTIFSFYIVSKEIVPANIKEAIERSIEHDFLKDNAKAKVILTYDIEKDDYADNLKGLFDSIDGNIYEYLSSVNKMYASIYRNAIKNVYEEKKTIDLKVAQNKSLSLILNDIKNEIKTYIKDSYGIDVDVTITESEDIKNDKAKKIIEEKNAFFEKEAKRYAELEAKRKEEAEKENEKDEDEKDEKKRNKYIAKKRKSTSRIFYDDGDSQIFGRYLSDNAPITNIATLVNDVENICVKGTIFNVDIKEELTSKNTGKKFGIVDFDITDGQNALKCSIFVSDLKYMDAAKSVLSMDNKKGVSIEVIVEGNIKYDDYNKEFCMKDIDAIKKIGYKDYIYVEKKKQEDCYKIFVTDREDNETEKRVELHLHTKFSEQDGVGAVSDYMKACDKFGMSSIAITDHGVLQALPIAYNYIHKDKKRNNIKNDIKLILGVEGYLVDDEVSLYMDNDFGRCDISHDIDDEYVVLDLITTGINYNKDMILSISATKIKGRYKVSEKIIHIKPKRHLTFEEKNRTNIKESDLVDGVDFKDGIISLVDYIYESKKSAVVCGLNIKRDINFIKNYAYALDDEVLNDYIKKIDKILDMMSLAKFVVKDVKKFTRETIAKYYELDKDIKKITKDKDEQKKLYNTNNISYKVMLSMLGVLYDEHMIRDMLDINEKFVVDENYIKHTPYNHIVLLAKNDVGRTNLYKLVSDSHISYFNKRPRMPRSLIKRYRDGLILGSACVQGELMEAIISGENDNTLKEIASFYDYLEIQPIYNNSFLLNNPKYNEMFTSDDDLKDINRKVIEIGDSLSIPVVATCDCHYVDKEDKIFRTILQYNVWHKKSNLDKEGKVKESDNDEATSEKEELYFRTTGEMLEEFSYLGEDKAYEVVIKNTKLISDMCEDIAPTRPDKCPPSIDNAENELRDACMQNAHKIYGDNLPRIIQERLDIELHKIIDNGYSVMYISAKRLIDDSVEHGYMVGSRGSVGSSLVATMIGVSEVNPLPPHYVCPHCHHVEIDTDETNRYLNDTGFDMPDKDCPICGTKMKKDGVNIPFETFLGVEGGKPKEPDIDLNFSGEYQSRAHEKTKKLFGEDHTFKAGTVTTVAKETSYGYIRKYDEENNIISKKADIEYQKTGITDCKRSTGQHPGGMVVVPNDEYIYTFTPIQYPANKEENGKTTHFEYHEIEENLLKLDILGQDGPTFIKKLKDITNVDPMEVPFYDEKVISLFKDLSSIGLKKEDIHGETLGCLSIPEFGTSATMKMCKEAKPKSVADLIRISGLAHGTDVWVGNIRDIVLNKIAPIDECVCCRDDIMIYLNERGLENTLSFDIMESVRKGKKLTYDWEEKMRDKGVPEWYIDCCNKIKYMFPKAHAAAYVTTSLRVGYYKIYFPIEYYTVYFSIKWDHFNYEMMCGDIESVRFNLDKMLKEKRERNGGTVEDDDNKYDSDENGSNNDDDNNDNGERTANQDKKEKDTITMLKICEECLARNIEFTPIDIYKAKPFDFIIDDGKIMPSLATIEGLGKDKVEKFYEEAKKGKFTSKEDLLKRTKISQTVMNKMIDLGILPDLKEKEGISISDYL